MFFRFSDESLYVVQRNIWWWDDRDLCLTFNIQSSSKPFRVSTHHRVATNWVENICVFCFYCFTFFSCRFVAYDVISGLFICSIVSLEKKKQRRYTITDNVRALGHIELSWGVISSSLIVVVVFWPNEMIHADARLGLVKIACILWYLFSFYGFVILFLTWVLHVRGFAPAFRWYILWCKFLVR